MKKVTYLVLSISLLTSSVSAQKNNIVQPELESGTIEQQFDYIINKSSKFKDFQLIRRTSILKVKSHTLDSVKMIKKELEKANISALNATKNSELLKTEVESLNAQIEAISKDVDRISFLGMPLTKAGYNGFVWLLIAAISIGLLIFIFLFKKGHTVTSDALNDLDKVNAEFEAFRKKALVKEQETMRKLQNEINKHAH